MLIQRRLGPNGVYQRRILQLSADAPLFRSYLPIEPGGPYRRRLIGYFVASDHPASSGPAGGGSAGRQQTAITVISG